MIDATGLVKTTMHAAPVIVATGAVVLATMEPVCQVVKGAWERHVLKVDDKTANDRYEAIDKKPLADCDAIEKATKVATTVNNHRPYAGANGPMLIAGFLLGIVALKSLK